MQKRCRLEKKIQFPEACGNRRAAGKCLDASKNNLEGILENNRVENQLVGVVEAERDGIAFFQSMPFDLLAVHENAVKIATVFQMVAALGGNNRAALAGNTRVGKLKIVVCAATAPDEEGRLVHNHQLSSTIGSDDVQFGSAACCGFRHRIFPDHG